MFFTKTKTRRHLDSNSTVRFNESLYFDGTASLINSDSCNFRNGATPVYPVFLESSDQKCPIQIWIMKMDHRASRVSRRSEEKGMRKREKSGKSANRILLIERLSDPSYRVHLVEIDPGIRELEWFRSDSWRPDPRDSHVSPPGCSTHIHIYVHIHRYRSN